MTTSETETREPRLFRIGEVAERAGVSCRTLRYYEELGLLAPAEYSTGGARRYAEQDVARLLRIRELQELLGFDLGEIKVVLGAEDQRAGLRSEYLGGADVGRRREILAEAVEINERLRALVARSVRRLRLASETPGRDDARPRRQRRALCHESPGAGGRRPGGRARRVVDFAPVMAENPGSDQVRADQLSIDEASLDRVLTVPNVITFIRLACIPLFLWLLFGAHRQTDSAILLAVLGATDWVDGHVARRWHQVSTLGKVLDPVADRLLVGTAVIAVIIHGAVPLWFGVATVAREVLVSGAVLLLAALGAERIDVLWVGKAGTFGLMVAYPIFLVSHGPAGWQSVLQVVAWLCAAPALVLAYIAAAAYVPVARRALSQGRHGRRGDEGVPGPGGPGGSGTGDTPGG